jgi:small subunit ribosomal protein S8
VVNDTISDMLTRIRNANMVKHQIVEIPFTKISLGICLILKEEGFIEDFDIYMEKSRKNLLILLKYKGKSREPVITAIQRVSKPGLRVYRNAKKLPRVLANLGIAISK